MMNALRSAWLIAHSVLIEAVRRKEIYAIVLVSCLLIGAVMSLDFFGLRDLTKFYREIALKTMSIATALATVVLAARQLPREFETRTIYPLLAKPVSRMTFMLGKLLGVMLAAAFCYALFMAVYIGGTYYLGGSIPWGIFLQYIYLQLLMILILASLCFWLSMVLNLDAALTIGVLFYLFASTFTTMTSYIYDYVSKAGQVVLVFLTYAIPQLTLFDLSEKAVHADSATGWTWDPLSIGTMAGLTAYGGFFVVLYVGFAMYCFRRRAL